jgi:hypothetical protein
MGMALLLAFPLRESFQRTVITPLAYVFWAIGVVYRITPQLLSWVLALVVVILLLIGSLIPESPRARRRRPESKPRRGQVEQLAQAISKAQEGRYFKWLVANRLGRLAYTILGQREGNANRSVFAPLVGADWQPAPRLQKYLETGLHGSFSDYPPPGRVMSAGSRALDPDIEEAVTFLEGQLELHRDRRR